MGAGTWESHHAITGLMYRYTEAIDAGDFDGIGAIFAHAALTALGALSPLEASSALAPLGPLLGGALAGVALPLPFLLAGGLLLGFAALLGRRRAA